MKTYILFEHYNTITNYSPISFDMNCISYSLQDTILQNTYSTWQDQLITDVQSSSAYIHTTNPATIQENIQYTENLSDLETPQTKSSNAGLMPLEPDQNFIIQKSIEFGDPSIISNTVRFIINYIDAQ